MDRDSFLATAKNAVIEVEIAKGLTVQVRGLTFAELQERERQFPEQTDKQIDSIHDAAALVVPDRDWETVPIHRSSS